MLALQAVINYAKAMELAGKWRQLAYLHHLKHDETPLKIDVEYADQGPLSQVNKVYVIETRWAVLLEDMADPNEHLMFSGSFGTSARAAENATAETITAILDSCPQPVEAKQFLFRWRIVESDNCSTNSRVERIIADKSDWPNAVLHSICAAHNTHHIASKTWALLPQVMTGAIQTLLVLQSPGGYLRFTEAVLAEVEERFVFLRGVVLSDAADAYRSRVLKLFAPRQQRRKAYVTIQVLSSLVFNGDWTGHAVTHVCTQCCASEAEALASVKRSIPTLLRALRFKMLSRADWSHWLDALSLIGFLASVNKLFASCFRRAFASIVDAGDGAGMLYTLEDEAQADAPPWRAELSFNAKKALQFWSEGPEWQLQLLATALHDERAVMEELLRSSAVEYELDRLDEQRNAGVS